MRMKFDFYNNDFFYFINNLILIFSPMVYLTHENKNGNRIGTKKNHNIMYERESKILLSRNRN